MLSSWSKDVCIQLLQEAPFLADIFVRIPIRTDPQLAELILSLKEGHPQFFVPSGLQASAGTTASVIHHLYHLLFQHPALAWHGQEDVPLHLAMDSVVNQQLPADLRAVSPAYSVPASFPEHANLFEAWTWWTLHAELALTEHLEAINDHTHWKANPAATHKPVLPIHTQWPLPSRIEAIIQEDQTAMGSLNWQQQLIQKNSTTAATHLTWTTRKASRRYGTQPGVRIRSRGNLAIILDTSGSMSLEDINAFFAFLPQITRFYRQIQIVESDYQVRKSYTYTGITPTIISGRSDTFFQPALDFVLQNHRPDAIWYVTDGQASPPQVKGAIPIFWVLCGDLPNPEQLSSLPGQKILMNHPPKRGVMELRS